MVQKKIKFAPISHIPFYFIRRGQTDWNKEYRIMGQTDISLNAVGLQQAERAAQYIVHLRSYCTRSHSH